ncbi:MAG: rRNA pseudouridine synthase [Clostridia bacterium]|nr:rRNA pseudouridine synthase [Clostridia bacterium]
MTDGKVRLQKYLAECGVASRRKCEELIENGKVKVNGHTAVIGDKINPKKDLVTVSGKKIIAQKENTYIVLHKPRGFITTMSDEMDRKCVAELIKDLKVRVFPVGRLDRDSEGMLLFTNDGEFANAMTHPTKHVPKTYRVTVRPSINEEQLTSLTTGIVIDDRKTAPAEVHVVTKEENRVVLEIILYEGRNRQIRKMCEEVGLEVARLKRTAIGSIKLGMLKQGSWRHLTDDEVRKLMIAAGMERKKK